MVLHRSAPFGEAHIVVAHNGQAFDIKKINSRLAVHGFDPPSQYKIIDTLEKNKADLVAVQPVLREFSGASRSKKSDMPYHPGALKYFKEHNIEAKALQ